MTGKADAVRAVSQQFKDRTNTVITGVMAHLRDDNAREILGPGLSPLIGRGSLKSIVTFALYADVLRMVRDMVMADGEISDEEVQESLGLLSVLAGGFAKVRKEYASFASLTALNARDFLTKYTSDSGLFGHANASTKWAGVNACRNIEATCGDSGPLKSFGGALVSWADSVASADGMSTTEQQHLAAIRSLCTSARDASHSHAPATDTGPSSPEDLLTAAILESDPHGSKSGFTHMEDGAAALLAGASYPLTLNRLVTLSPYAAACLGKHAGGTLELNGLLEISDGVAEGLSTRTKTLSLNGLVRLTDASAMHLSRCAAKLSLRGLTELADTPGHLALAAKLASQQGDLVLDGLERLGPKVAAKLSEHGGRLALRGLTSVDDAVLTALFNRSAQPELSADMLRTLFARGSGAFVTQYCITNSGDVGILQSLTTRECNPAAAQAMVNADKDLRFDEIQEIAPEIGSILATTPHDIRVGQLASLSEESARGLREHSGSLIIGRLVDVSLGAAKALADHHGPVAVEDIDDLPEDVAAVLGQHSERGESAKSGVGRVCELLNTVQGLASYHPADLLRDVDFKELAAAAEAAMQELREYEHQNASAVEQACGVLEQVQGWGDLDLADFRDVDFQRLADDAAVASRGLQVRSGDMEQVNSGDTDSADKDWIESDHRACADLLRSGDGPGEFLEKHIDRLATWKMSAEAGDPRAQLLYGFCFFYGHGVDESDSSAAEWFKAAADQGNANAQYSLGKCYLNGWGVAVDENKAAEWYGKAAAQGYPITPNAQSDCPVGFPNQADHGTDGLGDSEEGFSNSYQEEARMAEKNMLTKQAAEKLLGEGYEEFCDFTAMDDAAASALSAYKGKICFPDIEQLSESQARILSTHEGGLSFTALQDFSAEVASHLAASRGDLELRGTGIAEANVDVVRTLAAHGDGSLTLGLVRITEGTAQLLAEHVGSLDLPDLEELPEAAADLLATHAGPLSVNESLLAGSCELHRRLARHPSIWVCPLTIYEHELAEAAEGKAPESVAASADGMTFFAGATSDYYGDEGAKVLAIFRKAPWKPFCVVEGVCIGEEYRDTAYYFVGTKKQVLNRISGLE